MKKLFVTAAILLSMTLAVGCKQDPVKEYGEGLLDSMDAGKVAVDQANLRSLKHAVRVYHSENGMYPSSLEEVTGFLNSPVDLGKYDYNPGNGQVSLR